MLILDLDKTIFKPKSMDSKIFQPLIDIIESYYHSINKSDLVSQIIEELWSVPLDEVFKKFHTPEIIQQQTYKMLNNLNYTLNIMTYEDYDNLKSIPQEKILVTTGYRKLQLAKIKALNIGADFKEIFIDSPLSNNRKYKLGIFKDILKKENLKPKEVWIIGDSIENEIKAGNTLGMNTIQRLKTGDTKSKFSDYGITSFQELKDIIS